MVPKWNVRALERSACTASKFCNAQVHAQVERYHLPWNVEVLCLGWWMAWLARVHSLTCRTDSCCACSQHFRGRQFREPHPPVQDVVHLHCKKCAGFADRSGAYPLCLPCAKVVLERGTCPASDPHRLGNQARLMPRNLLWDIIES